jgi:ATP-dependent Lhr-like helicase
LHCLYVSPLKALGLDVRANLLRNWRAMQSAGLFEDADLRIGLRTGDTSQRVRRRQITNPPAILLTTPESLAQLLANSSARELFQRLRWIILDEIHALAGNKRGADLALSLERLTALNIDGGPQRIGLSATCTPLAAVGQFLAGAGRSCTVAQVNDVIKNQLVVEPLDIEGEYSPAWLGTLLDRVERELSGQRTTLIFTNTRHLAERVTWALRRRHPVRQEEIAVHHSSLSPVRRRRVERKLKQGRLWVVVSSASLELGIDIGSVDGVVFVHPPGGVARLLQRVGRSGHRPGQPRRGLLLTATTDELIEAAVTAGSGRAGQIEPIRISRAPLDVLCQHLAGMAMTEPWSADVAYALVCGSAPYRDLAWSDFQDCLDYLSGRLRDGTVWLPARLRWEGDVFRIADARTARLLRRNLGSILTEDACSIRLRLPAQGQDDIEPPTAALGEVDTVYADRLQPGDRFVLDGRCLEMKERTGASLLVDEVFGRPRIPHWQGSGAPLPAELAQRIYLCRFQAAEALRDGPDAFAAWLRCDFHLDGRACAVLQEYFLAQETVSEIPGLTTLLIECVAAQSCTEYYLHTPLPRNANEVLVRVLAQRWQPARRAILTAVAADLGIYVLTNEPDLVSPEEWRTFFRADRFAADLQAHLDAGDTVREHFTRVAQTGLMVLRHPAGFKRKVGGKDWTARRLYEQIRARVADFVLLRQTANEVREDLFDSRTAQAFVERLLAMTIRLRHLSAPSPLGESLLRRGDSFSSGATMSSDSSRKPPY